MSTDPLTVIVAEHDRFEIPYLLAGSFASTYRGSPRTTHDIDLILCKDRESSRSEFERRRRAEIGGLDVWMATAEDTIVAKLEWAKAGESERQLRDGRGILDLSGESLDRDYIERWVSELDLRPLWRRVTAEAE